MWTGRPLAPVCGITRHARRPGPAGQVPGALQLHAKCMIPSYRAALIQRATGKPLDEWTPGATAERHVENTVAAAGIFYAAGSTGTAAESTRKVPLRPSAALPYPANRYGILQ